MAWLLVGAILPIVGAPVFAEELSLSWATTFGHSPNASRVEFYTPVILNETNGNTRLFGVCHQALGTFRFGTNSFPATVDPASNEQIGDIYMARLDALGQPLSAKLVPRTGYMTFDLGVAAIDASGNAVLSVRIANHGYGDLSLAGLSLPDESVTVLVKLDVKDDVVWAKYIDAGGIWISSVAFDPAGNLLVGGGFSGIKSIDGVILDASSGGVQDCFAAKFSPGGDLLWVRTTGGVEPPGVYRSDQVNGIATDSSGNVLIGGTIVNGASFGGQIVNTAGAYDVFVASYSAEGELNWVYTTGMEEQSSPSFQVIRITGDGKPILVHTSYEATVGQLLHVTVLDQSGQPENTIPAVLTASSTGGGGLGNPLIGFEVTESNDVIFMAWTLYNTTLLGGGQSLATGPDEQSLVFGGSFKLDGTWNWLRPIARSRYPTNSTPERMFLPGPRAWSPMGRFTAGKDVVRFAGSYLSPEPFLLADGTLPSTARYDSQIFVAELDVKPSPPSLTVTFDNISSFSVAWPVSFSNFVLESTTTLANNGDWQSVLTTPIDANGQKVVTLPSSGVGGFFRLRRP